MTGRDFLALAGALVANPALGSAESRFRTAVSRAYYAAFHVAVEFLAEFRVTISGGPQGHFDAFRKMLSIGHPDAITAARLLSDLRSDRNEADYRLDRTRFGSQENARTCVEKASDFVSQIEKCLSEPARSQIEASIGTT